MRLERCEVVDRPSDAVWGLPRPVSEQPWSTDFVMQAIEVLPVALRDGEIVSLKPEHADSFIIAWPAGAKPESVAEEALLALGQRAIVLHSTSWRHAAPEVVLTYLAVVSVETPPESWIVAPVARADLARGSATGPPPVIGTSQVLEHALRHLAWLVNEDTTIAAALPEWRERLRDYVPEPFRALGARF